MHSRHFIILSLFAAHRGDSFDITSINSSNYTFCDPFAVGGYASPRSCILSKMQSMPFRVAFLDKQYVTQNQPAVDKVTSMGLQYTFGQTCDRASTAIPEWCQTYHTQGHLLSNNSMTLDDWFYSIIFIFIFALCPFDCNAASLQKTGNTGGSDSSCGESFQTT